MTELAAGASLDLAPGAIPATPAAPAAPAVSAAAEMDFGMAGLQKLADGAPAKPPPKFRWLTETKRVETYELKFPFELDGVEHRVITIKRMTAGEVAAFMEKLRTSGDENAPPPMFYNGDVELGREVLDMLMDDDRFELDRIADGFLSARFKRAATEPSSSTPSTGDTSASS